MTIDDVIEVLQGLLLVDESMDAAVYFPRSGAEVMFKFLSAGRALRADVVHVLDAGMTKEQIHEAVKRMIETYDTQAKE